MNSYIQNILIVSALLFTANAAYVDSIKKCSIKDASCLQDFFLTFFTTWTTTGFPEFEVAAADPLSSFENDTLALADNLNIVLNKGIVKGLKNCIIKKYQIDLDKGLMSHDIYCDSLLIDADLSVSGSNALIQGLLGGKQLHGSYGHGTVTVEKMGVHFHVGCKLTKGNDGKTYFYFPDNKNKHNHDVENVKVSIGKLIIGDQNIGPFITDVVNQNSKLFIEHFGSAIIDKVLEYFISDIAKFFSKVPTESFVTEDLSSYV